jgi:hypothetical protein
MKILFRGLGSGTHINHFLLVYLFQETLPNCTYSLTLYSIFMNADKCSVHT